MSWLSVTLRKTALGSMIADGFKGLEQKVTTAVATAPPVQEVQHEAINDFGEKIKQLVVDKVVTAVPGAETVAPEVATPLFAYLEASLEHFLQGVEGVHTE